MNNWTPRTTRTGIDYNGAYRQQYWNGNRNPGAAYVSQFGTYANALPNCTTYAYGRMLEASQPVPVSSFVNANQWHNYMTNGWTALPFDLYTVETGDIVEWAYPNNHVAVVEEITNNVIYVSQSYFTGDDGTANSDRTGAVWGSTKQQVNDYGLAHYPNRFFNYAQITAAYGVNPTYILKNPNNTNNNINTWMLKRYKKKNIKVVII